MNYTQAPWTWHKNYGYMTGGDGSEVFSSEPYEGMWLSFGPTQESNARLIAAAPELFETLLLVENYLVERGIEHKGKVGRTEILPKIRAALSKATESP